MRKIVQTVYRGSIYHVGPALNQLRVNVAALLFSPRPIVSFIAILKWYFVQTSPPAIVLSKVKVIGQNKS